MHSIREAQLLQQVSAKALHIWLKASWRYSARRDMRPRALDLVALCASAVVNTEHQQVVPIVKRRNLMPSID